MRMRRHAQRTISIALAALAVCAAPAAFAGESDWLFHKGTAQGINLGALKFRPDGLLEAGVRYPHHPGAPWTAEQSKRAIATYTTRLIDCESGFYIDTGKSLIDKHGATIVSRPYGPQELVDVFEDALRNGDAGDWPKQGAVFLACAAASNNIVQDVRKRRAAQPQPVLANEPASLASDDDSDLLYALIDMKVDFPAIARQAPKSAPMVLDLMRLQYVSWRKSINAAYVPAAAPRLSTDAATLQSVNSELAEVNGSIKNVNGSTFDVEYPIFTEREEVPAKFASLPIRRLELARVDCPSGLVVPLSRNWYDDAKDVVLETVTLSAREALVVSANRKASDEDNEIAFMRYIHQVCSMLAPAPAASTKPVFNAIPFGITTADLLKNPTPEAMLLKMRAVRRAHMQ